MKMYKGSYTVEAAVLTGMFTIVIVNIIMLAIYTTDCQIARNVGIIEGINSQEKYFYYKSETTGYLNQNKKIQDTIFNGNKVNDNTLEEKLKLNLICGKVTNVSGDKGLQGITMSGMVKFEGYSAWCKEFELKEEVSNRNEADFLRIVNALAKEVFE